MESHWHYCFCFCFSISNTFRPKNVPVKVFYENEEEKWSQNQSLWDSTSHNTLPR